MVPAERSNRREIGTSWLINGLGQRVAQINVSVPEFFFVYDEAGHLTGKNDANGRAQALPASEESCPRSMPALRNARSYFESNAESKMREGSAGQLSQPLCCISASS